MPSQLHDSHLLLFRNQPTLAAALIHGALGVELPPYQEGHVVSADLTDVQPAEYRAQARNNPELAVLVRKRGHDPRGCAHPLSATRLGQ